MRRHVSLILLALVAAIAAVPAQQPDSIVYRLSFDERVHRLMDVEATFSQLPAGPLRLRVSRSSPGRYALHEFAKNVFDVRAVGAAGQPLTLTQPRCPRAGAPPGKDRTAVDAWTAGVSQCLAEFAERGTLTREVRTT
jgi:hypothetical protein